MDVSSRQRLVPERSEVARPYVVGLVIIRPPVAWPHAAGNTTHA